ncbi:MAG TPA: DUF6427 family protein [Bacteroidales bacterium]|nr:DUF6427 family protein [Bacteroidales bacterium]
MLLKQFKGNATGTILLIIVTLLLVWASAFIKLQSHFSLYFDLDPMPLYGILSSLVGTHPLPGIFFTLALVSLMAFSMVNLNTTLFFINQRTLLPAVIYILLSGLFPQYQLMNPAIFGAMFLMLAIRRIMDSYRVPGIAYNFFDAGIFIGIGSLFYADLIWFGLLVIIGMLLLRTGNIKEIFIAVIGIATPFILTFGIYYVLGRDVENLWSIIGYNLFGRPDSYVFTPLTIVAISIIGLITLVSMVHLLMLMNTKKIKSRKTFFLFLWLFLISVVVYIVLPTVSVEIIWIIGIPVSYFLAHYFVFIKKKLIPEIFFSVLYILILVVQIWYLK